MVIIQMSGGLGNQMFQYALYLKLKQQGKEVKFDSKTTYETGSAGNALVSAREVQLSVFGMQYPEASPEDMIAMTDSSMRLKDRIRRKITGRKSKEYDESGFGFDPKVLEIDPAYLVGVYQSEKYFADIREQVKSAFQFEEALLPQKVMETRKQIASSNAISIHVRRGDYLNNTNLYGEICTDAYYDTAIRYMLERYPDAIFYLFTNDTAWADSFVTNRPYAQIEVVRGNTEETGYLDMYLMKHCKHNIIANSSFSWWGAWLNDNPEKTIIAPATWLNGVSSTDIYTDEMIRIDKDGILVEEVVRKG